MKLFLFLIILLFSFTSLDAQEDKYVIVTIEKKTNGSFHKYEKDYWVISRRLWKASSSKATMPLFLVGFSASDFDECCLNDTLILFNYTLQDSFDTNYNSKLIQIVDSKRSKVQTIKKRWPSNGYEKKITVYLTPILGNFCFCALMHQNGSSKLGYDGQVAIPISNFEYDKTFWESEQKEQIRLFDYGNLPFVALHLIQW